jgi:hypothetical protein
MKWIRHISALITLMLIFFACEKRSQQAEPLIFDDQPVVELSDSNTISTNVQNERNKNDEIPSSPVKSSSSTSSHYHKSSKYDNMRGFDPASEDDTEDNGMRRYMENNDEEGWD